MRADINRAGSKAFTLVELLLTLAIILLLISMLLPALNRGHSKVKGIQCRSNLHQTGLGMIFFAHAHEDKFPTQVSTNLGGSAEFIDAGNAVQGDFYFSYKHFLPLAADLESPKLLVCPTDVRTPATNFSALRNTNLSYFVSANPLYMRPDSIMAGDRNLSPVSNSIARLGVSRPLRWTGEMHQYRGNVLFSDGHVEQVNDVLSMSNSPGAPLTSLVMPSVKLPTAVPPVISGGGGFQSGGGGGVGGIPGGNLSLTSFSTNNSVTISNGVITNLTINSGPRHMPPSAYLLGVPGAGPSLPPLPPQPPKATNAQAVATSTPGTQPAVNESSAEREIEKAHQDLVDTGKDLVKRGSRFVYGLPWWALALLLLLALMLLKYAREHRRPSTAKARTTRPGFVAGKSGM